MRITGRQLRRIIQEEVARMVNEEDGTVVGATGTQTVKPVAVTGDPKFEQNMKTKAARQLAYLLAALSTFDKNNNIALNVSEGDRIEAMMELTSIADSSVASGRLQMKDVATWKITGFTVNGKNMDAVLPPKFKTEPGGASSLPPGERMKYRVSMTVPASVESVLSDNDYGRVRLGNIVDTFFVAIKDSITEV